MASLRPQLRVANHRLTALEPRWLVDSRLLSQEVVANVKGQRSVGQRVGALRGSPYVLGVRAWMREGVHALLKKYAKTSKNNFVLKAH